MTIVEAATLAESHGSAIRRRAWGEGQWARNGANFRYVEDWLEDGKWRPQAVYALLYFKREDLIADDWEVRCESR